MFKKKVRVSVMVEKTVFGIRRTGMQVADLEPECTYRALALEVFFSWGIVWSCEEASSALSLGRR